MILDALKQRLRAALGRPTPSAAELMAARGQVTTLLKDGSWADLDREGDQHSPWPSTVHLERVLALARARELCPGELDAAVIRALDFWLARDFPAPDPWGHQIVVPRLVGSVAVLCEDVLTPGARGKVTEILARAQWSRWHAGTWTDWTSTQLAAVAFNILLRGCLQGDGPACQQAFERVYGAVRYAPAGEDGIQADGSFRHEDAPTPAGRYGLTFAEDVARFLVLGHGTAWQAPAPCLALFASFLLDGQQWLIRRRFFDAGFPDGVAESSAPLDGFVAAVEELAALGATPRRAEIAAFARRLRAPSAPAFPGHRHFWRAGLAVHRRPAFYTSVRTGGGPGQRADGAMRLVQRGDEHRGILWDRQRLPGTTALQTAPSSRGEESTSSRQWTLAGSVTDGEFGVTAMSPCREGVTARKAWFYFDQSITCLGSEIACEDPANPVRTSINQCVVRGDAVAFGKGGETHVLAAGKSYDLSAAHRLEHDGFAYHFPEPMAVRARLGPQGALGSGGALDVFSLWIDHGIQPRHEAYAYTVLPTAEPDGRPAIEHELSQIKILANTAARQAVWHQELRLVGIVFWEAGVVALPGGGRVAVNRPCILLGQAHPNGESRLSVANPTPEPATIHVEYANRCLCFNLPAGPQDGRSLSRAL